ncbi:MAG: 4Fe-4S binding protein [Bdellovibrionales bacterium]|nr:4Fe-4S binding protein [Oligoflexia bacterium]
MPRSDPAPPYRPKARKWVSTRTFRIACQLGIFAIWAALIFLTRHPIQNILTKWIPVSILLRADPLVSTVVMGSMRIGVGILFLGAFTAGVSLLLGRVFCGWVCPLGSIFDFYSTLLTLFKVKHHGPSPSWYRFKFYLLLVTVLLAVFGVASPLIGLDPIVLLTRVMATIVSPLSYGSNWIDFSTLFLFAGIMAYTTRVSRIWCRTACPLGAYLGAVSRVSVLRRETEGCVQCQICSNSCPTGAIDFKNAEVYNESECIKCFVCSDVCPVDANFFQFQKPVLFSESQTVVELGRRDFMKTAATAAVLVPVLTLERTAHASPNQKDLIRPPMSRKEEDFLSSCIRCGECMKACPTEVLRPAGFQYGLRALWTPVMNNLESFCQPGCNACSVACPTDAIQKYPIEDKYAFKAGTAVFNSALCISYTEQKFCSECVRQCPTNAIEFTKGWEPFEEQDKTGVAKFGADIPAPTGKLPTRPTHIRFDLCIGCGACESSCNQIVLGDPAMKNTSFGRATESAVLKNKT